MNERIRELAEQAMETVDVSIKLGMPGTELVFNKEKFAQLIVRECAKVSERTGSLNEADFEGEMIADAIK